VDTTRLGQVAADLMDLLAEDAADEEAAEMELGEVMILAEVKGRDEEGDDWTSIRFRCSDPRFWVQRGMLSAALDGERLAD
jgi:hypothetical protein